jgi:class 3 adenylate cyclase/CHASE2 domain-containing sensor protein
MKSSSLSKCSLLIPLLTALILLASGPMWQRLEFNAYDARVLLCRYLNLGNSDTSSRVVVVVIEEKAALKKKPLIFWYPDLGTSLKRMADARVKSVGLDIIPFHSLEQKLAEGIKGMDAPVPTQSTLEDIGRQMDNSLISGVMGTSSATMIIQGISGSLVPFYYDLMAFMENVRPGSLRVDTDPDGILRKMVRHPEPGVEGFVSQLYQASGQTRTIPETFNVNFALIDKIPIYPFDGIINKTLDLNLLKDKTVVLGLLSKQEDVHETPVGTRSGVLVHAAALETLLTGSVLKSSSFSVQVATLVILCFGTYPLTRFRRPFISFGWISSMIALYFMINLLAFSKYYVIPLFPHVLAPVVVFSASYLYRYIIEERSKRQLYQTFSYYVEPQIIDELITKDPTTLMRGERHDVCIMFLDIRGFTALSEKISSESLVSMLNVFFGRVSEIVQDNHGFVNKFIGDGMLAFFAVGDAYVDDALKASREICQATKQLNLSGELTTMIGENSLAIGIGLHSGSVILGNIGSHRKMDFTVIGPPVNTASRIESLTKQYAREVLVSDSVQVAASGHFAFDSLGRAEVKGIDGGVEIFALNL